MYYKLIEEYFLIDKYTAVQSVRILQMKPRSFGPEHFDVTLSKLKEQPLSEFETYIQLMLTEAPIYNEYVLDHEDVERILAISEKNENIVFEIPKILRDDNVD
ncbi:hypothetical protein [Piscibacillus sp. B03]|uniref:hypothetical protein n=1 Tax=Piscibacillus sp. B03 TaxID=3457430 RepID=UPI003FCD8311